MKKLSKMILLVGCFFMLASTAANAQNSIKNNTPCKYIVKVKYGTVTTCGVVGTSTIIVPPYTVVTVPGAGTNEILYAKGVPTTAAPGTCAFYIAQNSCAPYPLVDNVACGTACGNYTATLIPGYGIYLN